MFTERRGGNVGIAGLDEKQRTLIVLRHVMAKGIAETRLHTVFADAVTVAPGSTLRSRVRACAWWNSARMR